MRHVTIHRGHLIIIMENLTTVKADENIPHWSCIGQVSRDVELLSGGRWYVWNRELLPTSLGTDNQGGLEIYLLLCGPSVCCRNTVLSAHNNLYVICVPGVTSVIGYVIRSLASATPCISCANTSCRRYLKRTWTGTLISVIRFSTWHLHCLLYHQSTRVFSMTLFWKFPSEPPFRML